ncbi:ABC transporter substrate-binding protein [Streptomyces pathocidini]|uniref:ABC transporter substrate-binding protein n=1 Tax=Streptomyces pathocidini TaxID=1650571 RepID=A0ABW7UTG5_9ACTN|nr:ABC transporter substrate-binding protein [Streptomyces pathocidini]
MNRKTMALPAIAALLASALAGCGGSDEPGGDSRAIVVGTTDSFELTGESPAPFDPALAYEAGSWNVLRNTFQTLMALPRSGGEPVPEAAYRCGFSDTQNESYRCKLRSGLKFANGHALTAADVKFSIERTLKIKNPNGPVSLLANIDAVETPGDRDVVFHLKSPDATFPHKLATPAAAIVDSQAYDGGRLRNGYDVDGSGPYILETKAKGGRLVSATFTRNPHYKGELEPKNDKVEMRFFPDADAMEKSLKGGGIDLMTRTMAPDQIARIEREGSEDIELVEMPGQEIRYLAFDTKDGTAGRKAVRQAIAQVVDRQALVRDVYERTAEPLYSIVPTSVGSHLNSFFNKYGEPDAAKARKILDAAGVGTPVPLTLTYTTDHYGSATAKEFAALKKQLNDSGLFRVTVKGEPWKTFRPAQSHQEYPVYGMGWFPDFPDADNFIAPFFGEDNFLGSPYRNSTVAKLIPQTRRQAQRTAAAEGFQRAQDIVAEDVPVLPLWQGKQYVAARDDVTGVEWALNSSSVLQLWELGRAAGS